MPYTNQSMSQGCESEYDFVKLYAGNNTEWLRGRDQILLGVVEQNMIFL